MKQAYPSIPAEVKERLERKGFRPYKAEPLPDFLNPHSRTCIRLHFLILI